MTYFNDFPNQKQELKKINQNHKTNNNNHQQEDMEYGSKQSLIELKNYCYVYIAQSLL
jgi:hypothetical protein